MRDMELFAWNRFRLLQRIPWQWGLIHDRKSFRHQGDVIDGGLKWDCC